MAMAVYTDIGRIIRMSHGKCILESDYTWNQCVGCNGVADSETAVNPCSRCVDLHRNDFFDFGRDCDGCKELDECAMFRNFVCGLGQMHWL